MSNHDKEEQDIETKKVICWASPGCSSSCGLLVKVKDGKIIDMRGNPEYPSSRGAVCAQRFPHLNQWLEHPDQLLYPLKRKGERGENQWERISWDQALDEIAEKLTSLKEEYGAEMLTTIEGTYRSDLYGIRGRFLNLFGNPQNSAAPGITCGCNKEQLAFLLAGSNLPSMVRILTGLNSPKCLVFCGTYLPEARPIAWRQIKNRLRDENRPKVIVIDPRRTEMAEVADIWLQIRPGTDTALFMAWLNIIISEKLYDEEFINEWTYGFERLKERAAEYPPEKVADITWIPVDKIYESARLYAASKPAAITVGLASDHIGRNALRVEHARICLHAVTGNMRAEYGETPTGPGPIINGKMGIRDAMLQMEERCSPEARKKQIGADRFKLMTWPAWEIANKYYQETYGIPMVMCGHAFSVAEPLVWRSILEEKPYPTKALITWTSNPLINAANTKLVYKAMKSDNLALHVVLEHVMTPTALLADYVLPAASKLERGVVSTTEDFTPFFRVGEQAVPPLGERKHDYYFFKGLADRLGFGEHFPWETVEEFYDYRLQPLGLTFTEAAREKGIVGSPEPWHYDTINPRTGKPTGFATKSGKFELYSNVLDELGYDPMPYYEEPPESPVSTPEVAKEYPLILTTGGRWMPQFHSEHRQFGMGMREQHPDPLVDIHPDTAKAYGIEHGDWVYIETLRGVIKMKAKVTDIIHPQVVNAEHCWWFPEQPAQEPWLHGLWQSNANVLTMDDPDTCDPMTGGWPMRALLCKIYKVRKPETSGRA